MKLTMLVEIPTGSKVKLEFDEQFKKMRYKRDLLYPMVLNYGCFLDTRSPDGDMLDAILLAPPLAPDCIVEVKPLALLHIIDGDDVDDKVLCVPTHRSKYNKLKQVPQHLLNEIEHYFTIYKQLEKKKTNVRGWRSLGYTKKVIKKSQKVYGQENH